jgi:predicted metal-binding membrane protein
LERNTALDALVRRDGLTVVAALIVVIALSWAYLLAGAGMEMSMAMMTPTPWTPRYAVLMFAMWWVMMVAMMLPSAAPMILLFATVNRQQRETGHPHFAATLFVLGYLVMWTVFSFIAVVLQWQFERTRILSPTLTTTSVSFGALLLVAAGIYQLTPIKHACLLHCRSPLAFLSTHWRGGARGALHMGLLHGIFCVGCCWLLMGLLFLGGVMNLYWVAGVALMVLVEKTIPGGHWISYGAGVALLVSGVTMLAGRV